MNMHLLCLIRVCASLIFKDLSALKKQLKSAVCKYIYPYKVRLVQNISTAIDLTLQ